MSVDKHREIRLSCLQLAVSFLRDPAQVIETAKVFTSYVIGDNSQEPPEQAGGGDPSLPGTSSDAPRVRRGRPPGSARKTLE